MENVVENVVEDREKEVASIPRENGNRWLEMSIFDEDGDRCVSSLNIEHAYFEIETLSFCLLDLLYKVWDSNYSAIRNLRLIMASMSRYLLNQRGVDPSTSKMLDGCDLKLRLQQFHSLWLQKGAISSQCTKKELYVFLRDRASLDFYETLLSCKMSQEDFNGLVKNHREYVDSLPVVRSTSMIEFGEGKKIAHGLDTSMDSGEGEKTAHGPNASMDFGEGEKTVRGLEVLFDTSVKSTIDRIPQYIVIRDNGRLYSLKTPGEVGSQIIRLMTYDVKDILRLDKRHWWKHAKVRTQILSSPNDRKMRLLRQVLDEAADGLTKVSGAVKEARNLDEDGDF